MMCKPVSGELSVIDVCASPAARDHDVVSPALGVPDLKMK